MVFERVKDNSGVIIYKAESITDEQTALLDNSNNHHFRKPVDDDLNISKGEEKSILFQFNEYDSRRFIPKVHGNCAEKIFKYNILHSYSIPERHVHGVAVYSRVVACHTLRLRA